MSCSLTTVLTSSTDHSSIFMKAFAHSSRYKGFQSCSLVLSAGVLGRLLEVQKLDSNDIEGIYAMYQSLLPFASSLDIPPSICQEVSQPSGKANSEFCKFSVEEKKAAIREYLIAATAKDCSIMTAFCPARRTFVNKTGKMGKSCAIDCSVHLADLDFKPISKLTSHWKLDQRILLHACNDPE